MVDNREGYGRWRGGVKAKADVRGWGDMVNPYTNCFAVDYSTGTSAGKPTRNSRAGGQAPCAHDVRPVVVGADAEQGQQRHQKILE